MYVCEWVTVTKTLGLLLALCVNSVSLEIIYSAIEMNVWRAQVPHPKILLTGGGGGGGVRGIFLGPEILVKRDFLGSMKDADIFLGS